jgi:hypothetical protein
MPGKIFSIGEERWFQRLCMDNSMMMASTVIL